MSSPRNRCGNGICTKHEANRDGYTSRGQPSNFRKITHLPFRNRSPWIPPRALAPSCGTAKQANPSWTCPSLEQPTKPPPFFGTAIQPLRPPQLSPATKALSLPPRPPGQLRWVPPPPHRQARALALPPPSTRPAPVGTPPPTPQGILQKTCFFFLCALETTTIRIWGPCPYRIPPNRQVNPSLTPSPGIKALGLPPRPPGQLGEYPHPTGHPSKNAIFLLFVHVRNNKNTSLEPVPLPPTPPPEPKPLDRQANPSRLPVQASSGGYPPHKASFKKRHFFPEPLPRLPPG